MKIQNAADLSHEQLMAEMHNGARFVQFSYAISFIFTTLNKESGIFMIRPGEKKVLKAIPYILLTSLFGWWAFPFGPKHTIASLRVNFRGGKDITREVMDTVAGFLLFHESERKKVS